MAEPKPHPIDRAQPPPPYVDGTAPVPAGVVTPNAPNDKMGVHTPTPQPDARSPYAAYGQHPQMSPNNPPPAAANPRALNGTIVDMCPATGGPHSKKSRPGVCGIVIGICFCPIGLIAIPFDQRVECRNCRRVLEPDWCG